MLEAADLHPGRSGLDMQRDLASASPQLPIIFITGYGDVPTSVRAMKAGAAEFLTKPFADDVLLAAIRRAIEQSGAALDQEARLRGLRERYATLTRRGRERLKCRPDFLPDRGRSEV